MPKGRVVLAMSGGVDSSVSAHLLVQQGYDVVGLFMRTGAHEPADDSNPLKIAKTKGCCSAIDAFDAQRVADRLDIPFYALNFEEDFGRIKDYFADEYAVGRTPNPCVVCNSWLKFGKLWDYARLVGADRIATGHYARIDTGDDGVASLRRANDLSKDQSYFLFGLRKELLPEILFPVGGLKKSEVRTIALEAGLGMHEKPDSQEICFVPTGNYQDFLKAHRPESQGAEGEIVDEKGHVLGTHAGLSGFTIGQRKGLGIAVGEPRYVLSLEADTQRVVIGPRELLDRHSFECDRVNWLTPEVPQEEIPCSVKIRYLHQPAPAVVTPLAEGRVAVRFQEPQSAVTPGQACVFYDGDRVLGGGWIC